MAKIHGKFGELHFAGSNQPGTLTPGEVQNVHKWTLTTDADIEEATDFNSNGWKEFITGCVGFSAVVEGWWNNAEAKLLGTVADLPAIFGGNNASAKFYVDKSNSPAQMYSGNFLIASAEFDCDVKGNVTWKMNLTGNGPMLVVPGT